MPDGFHDSGRRVLRRSEEHVPNLVSHDMPQHLGHRDNNKLGHLFDPVVEDGGVYAESCVWQCESERARKSAGWVPVPNANDKVIPGVRLGVLPLAVAGLIVYLTTEEDE